MKKVYIAHPLLGSTDRENPDFCVLFGNLERVENICRRIVKKHPDILPLSPINAFAFLDVFERKISLKLCRELLSLADELWVFGNWADSEGCRKEIGWAKEMGIPVRMFTNRKQDRAPRQKKLRHRNQDERVCSPCCDLCRTHC